MQKQVYLFFLALLIGVSLPSFSSAVTDKMHKTKDVVTVEESDLEFTYYTQEDRKFLTLVGFNEKKYRGKNIKIIVPEKISGSVQKKIWDSNYNEWKVYNDKNFIAKDTIVNEIGIYAFKNCTNLKEIIFPQTILRIGASAFSGCTSLEKITLSENLDKIYENAFFNCTSLKSIILPEKITSINDNAFTGCTGWDLGSDGMKKAITIKFPPPKRFFPSVFANIKGVSGTKNKDLTENNIEWQNTLWKDKQKYTFFPDQLASLVMTEIDGPFIYGYLKKDKKIYVLGFKNNISEEEKKNVIIPNTITGKIYHINPDKLQNEKRYDYGTKKERTNFLVRIPEEYSTVSNKQVDGIATQAFQGSTLLTTITLPEGLNSIGDWAFRDCTALSNIVIPENTKTIGWGVFFNCIKLKSVSLPKDIALIEEALFVKCISLTSIRIPENVTSIKMAAFSGCANLKEIIFPTKLTSIDTASFSYCESLETIVFPEGIKTISDFAFIGCSKLKTILFPNSLEKIGRSAFSGCSKLESIILPKGLKNIENFAFADCTGLDLGSDGMKIAITIYGDIDSFRNEDFIPGSFSRVMNDATATPRDVFKNVKGKNHPLTENNVKFINEKAWKLKYKKTIFESSTMKF